MGGGNISVSHISPGQYEDIYAGMLHVLMPPSTISFMGQNNNNIDF